MTATEIEINETPQATGGFISWIAPAVAGGALTICLLAGNGAAVHEANDLAAIAGRYGSEAAHGIAVSVYEGTAVLPQGSAIATSDVIEVGLDLSRHSIPAQWFEDLKAVRTLEDIGFTLPWNE